MASLARLFRSSRSGGWTALEFGPDGLRAVSVSAPTGASGKPVVEKVHHIPEASLEPKALSQIGRQVYLSDSRWVATLPRKEYGIHVVAEPTVRPEEMGNSVRWAISTMVDYPVDTAYIAWMRIPTEVYMPGRPPHIYVASARPDVVDVHRQAFAKAKIDLDAIDIRETAHRNIAAKVEKSGEGVALLALSRRGVQFTITFKGELYLDRYIEENVFGEGIDEATRARACERIVLQVQRSLDFVGRTLPFIDINRVLVAPMPAASALRGLLAENLPIAVENLDLETVFDLSRVPALREEKAQSEYFVPLGAALRFEGGAA